MYVGRGCPSPPVLPSCGLAPWRGAGGCLQLLQALPAVQGSAGDCRAVLVTRVPTAHVGCSTCLACWAPGGGGAGDPSSLPSSACLC